MGARIRHDLRSLGLGNSLVEGNYDVRLEHLMASSQASELVEQFPSLCKELGNLLCERAGNYPVESPAKILVH
jgi:hypothetical protein